jgi:hypothetical protein
MQQELELPLFLWRSGGQGFRRLCIDLEDNGGEEGLQAAQSWALTFHLALFDLRAHIDGTGQYLIQQHNYVLSDCREYIDPRGMEELGYGRDGSYRFLPTLHLVSTARGRWLWSHSRVIGLRYLRDTYPLVHQEYIEGVPYRL